MRKLRLLCKGKDPVARLHYKAAKAVTPFKKIRVARLQRRQSLHFWGDSVVEIVRLTCDMVYDEFWRMSAEEWYAH